MKKVLIALILLLFILAAIPAAAEEAVTTVEAVTTMPVATSAPPVTEASPPADESITGEISAFLKEWIPEIMSAASLIVAMVLAYLFKKGLLPTVTRLLSTIADAVKHSHAKVTEETAAILECMNGFAARMTALEERLSSREDKLYSETELISEALTDMSDTLTDIFEHTNLPAEDKAMIADKHKEHTEKIQRILATLKGGDPDEK